jgi:hypothetical protein
MLCNSLMVINSYTNLSNGISYTGIIYLLADSRKWISDIRNWKSKIKKDIQLLKSM